MLLNLMLILKKKLKLSSEDINCIGIKGIERLTSLENGFKTNLPKQKNSIQRLSPLNLV